MKLSKKLVDEIQNEKQIPFNEMSIAAQEYIRAHKDRAEILFFETWYPDTTNIENWRINAYRIDFKKQSSITPDITFDDLVDQATRSIHTGLLEGGGKEMKARIYMWMEKAILWQKGERVM